MPLRWASGGDGDVAGGDALRGLGSLVVGEEEDLVALDGAADGAAELILVEGGAGLIEVALGVEAGVAEELEGVAMEVAGA